MKPLLSLICCLLLAATAFAQSARTEHFVVTGPNADEVAQRCEHCLECLSQLWLKQPAPDIPVARIEVSSRGGGEFGAGSTSFAWDDRRSNELIMVSGTWRGSREMLLQNVVPHEVNHIVFAAHFRQPTPRWYDEGAAQTVESEEQQRFQQELNVECLRTGRGIRFSTMMPAMEYNKDIMALYAQGTATVLWLLEQGGHEKFISFGESGLRDGWSNAFQEHYGYQNLTEVQDQWLSRLKTGRALRIGFV